MKSGFEFASETFERSKPLLKNKQKALFKRYLEVLKAYHIECQKLTLEQRSYILFDDVMINTIVGRISFKIKDCYDDIYPAQLDKKKIKEASMLVDNEINRINSLIDKIATHNYKSNYTEDEIRTILSNTHNDDEINHMISFSKEITEPANSGDNLVIFRKKEYTLKKIINQETSENVKHRNNIIVFPKK